MPSAATFAAPIVATPSPAPAPVAATTRLYFLDWLRILAFFVLILYHTGMYYVSWDWHVKSAHASGAIEPLMLLSSPWRLGLLFFISGVATTFMLGKLRVTTLLRQRSWRLLVPLVFGMLVIVPPQSYFEVVEKIAFPGSYGDFLKLYLSGYGGLCRGKDCLAMPTWNHLWFVAYLWVYTMLFGGLAWLAGPRLPALADALGRRVNGATIVLLPLALLVLVRVLLADAYPSTHALVGDWYNHALYLILFMTGALAARQMTFWVEAERLRWTWLLLWLCSWAITVCYYLMPEALATTPAFAQWRFVLRVVYCLGQWAPVLALCGFARHHLNTDSPGRRYLAEAVFPVYILHQTLIVSMAHWLKPVNLAPAVEGPVLVVLTLGTSLAVFAVVRRITVLRPLLGLGRQARA